MRPPFLKRVQVGARNALAAVGLSALGLSLVSGLSAKLALAQNSALIAPAGQASRKVGDTSAVWLAKYRQYPWNGFGVWIGSAYEVRTAANNEHFAGSMRMVGFQVSRDVWRGKRTRIAYLGEVLPVMLAHTRPPLVRQPRAISGAYDPVELARFQYREAYGFGLAPFGTEATLQLSPRTSALFNVTAGGLLFSKVVPYGHATKANFTVSPGVAFQFEPRHRNRIAIGYTFHHLSNASLGAANPGMNSQVLYMRIARLRSAASVR